MASQNVVKIHLDTLTIFSSMLFLVSSFFNEGEDTLFFGFFESFATV